jgi:hypothetical protein
LSTKTFEETNLPEIDHWKSKIETLIQEENLINPELTLTDLAKN